MSFGDILQIRRELDILLSKGQCNFMQYQSFTTYNCVCLPLNFSVGVTNIIRSRDKDGRKTVQFDMHEEMRVLGISSKFEIQLTVKELQENVATQMSGSLYKGWFQFNQGFRFTDAKEGGIMLEDSCQYTAPRFFARYIRGVGLTQHTAITENTRKYFMEVEKQNY